jgi:hypothetical protein
VKRTSIQRIVTLALAVLDHAAYGANKQKRDTVEVRLALAVLWCILREHRWLDAYWQRANNISGVPWEGCRESYYGICKTCRDEGWEAPV